MMGASGAVGGNTLVELRGMPNIERITLLGRKAVPNISEDHIQQKEINIFDSNSYAEFLSDHNTAICTLGVGQPSKTSREDFIKIDKTAVLDFGTACKKAGVRHFELLAGVGANSKSSSFYARTKGELIDGLVALDFERLSIFLPSMILTPTNRYGFSQALLLWTWPLLSILLSGSLRKYKGIDVKQLGEAIALNVLLDKEGVENLTWDDFQSITK